MKRFALAVSAAALLTAGSAWAENHALLVGASTYDNLDKRFWLRGPANDVDLVRTYLAENAPVPFDAANIHVLADGIEGSEKPTLAAIRGAFAKLADTVQDGDFVYLHFSGHGSQAPALKPDEELDGLDELFLPVDIGPWEDSIGTVQNALVDDEIGQLISGLRGKGAQVWAVFDSCHSGTVTRGAGESDVRMRKLDPAALGVPVAAMDAAQPKTRGTAEDPRKRPESPAGDALSDDGGFVAFFAAQTNETTPEERLPRGDLNRRSQGVFTYTIFETLAANPGLTYRQLGQEILRKYAVNNLALSTPMFEGDLDAYVFSAETGSARIAQWPVERGEYGPSLKAGTLHGLQEGDLLALLPGAASGVEDALGYVRVAFADTFSAELEATEHEGKPATDIDALPKGSFARKLEASVDFTLTVALPDAPDATLADALTQLQAAAGPRMVFVPAGREADIHLAVLPDSPRPDAVWFLPGSATFEREKLSQIPSVGTKGRDGAEIGGLMLDNLTRMAKAINLMRMGGQYADAGLAVDLSLRTKNRRQKQLKDLDTGTVPVLVPDDQVHVRVKNNEDTPVDLNVLHVGSDYAISHFFSGRLNPGEELKKGLFKITDEAFGRDRVIIVLTPAKPQSAVEDLRFLAQKAVATTRGGPASSFTDALRDAGFGTTTRGAALLEEDSGPSPSFLLFDIDTVPAR